MWGPPLLLEVKLILLILVLIGAKVAHSATITIESRGKGQSLVLVDGKIEQGDGDQFRLKTGFLSNAIVSFRSDGGSVVAGIQIGEIIRLKGFTTAVSRDARCASACALAWLGGTKRLMSAESKIGFHAAYTPDGRETGVGNALIGAYLNKIGLPYSAVAYITRAAPRSMTWLSAAEAKKHGIDVELVGSSQVASAPGPMVPSAAPAPPRPAAGPASGPGAAPEMPRLIYSPWAKFCGKGKDPSAKEVCFTGKDARTEAGQPAAAVALIEPEGEPKKLLRVTVPSPVQMQYGARIIIDTEPAITRAFFTCLSNGCLADYEATPDLINKLKKGQTLTLQAIKLDGKAMSVPVPLADQSGNSFQKAHEGPPTDPKVFEAQQKKLQEDLQKRADELRRNVESRASGGGRN
ncbi:MAG TPA: invasion associated locus B family protein [Xanthobacteraceae bacterium]|nr:invasion associated locus B family protein [Xanthobacteraceae bacterium]